MLRCSLHRSPHPGSTPPIPSPSPGAPASPHCSGLSPGSEALAHGSGAGAMVSDRPQRKAGRPRRPPQIARHLTPRAPQAESAGSTLCPIVQEHTPQCELHGILPPCRVAPSEAVTTRRTGRWALPLVWVLVSWGIGRCGWSRWAPMRSGANKARRLASIAWATADRTRAGKSLPASLGGAPGEGGGMGAGQPGRAARLSWTTGSGRSSGWWSCRRLAHRRSRRLKEHPRRSRPSHSKRSGARRRPPRPGRACAPSAHGRP